MARCHACLYFAEGRGKKRRLLSEFSLPVARFHKADVSTLLKKFADITVDELNSTEGIAYLKEYDAFYNLTGDFGPGTFACAGGGKEGEFIRLWSEPHGDTGSRSMLTIREADGRYLIQSLQDVESAG